MQDSVIVGTGDSKYIRSAISADATLADIITMLRAGTFPIDMAGTNAAGYTVMGTPLNKASLLNDAAAAALGLGSDATPTAAFLALVNQLNTIPVYGMTVVKDMESTSVTLAATAETRYIYGELTDLTVTSLPTEGFVNILFQSGSTPTVLTLPDTVKMPQWLAVGANMTVMISIADGIYGSAQVWDS